MVGWRHWGEGGGWVCVGDMSEWGLSWDVLRVVAGKRAG